MREGQRNPVTGNGLKPLSIELVEVHPYDFTYIDQATGQVNCVQVREIVGGLIYTTTEAHDRVPLGAIIVKTRGVLHNVPICVTYRDLLRAVRGEGYADDYYINELPAIEVALADAYWALQAVHDSDDLRDPTMVAEREKRLIGIIKMAAEGSGPFKDLAGDDAERALQVIDKLGRGNPMAAAMANWGITVQLEKLLDHAEGASRRVSQTRLELVRYQASVWGTLRDSDREYSSMMRWLGRPRNEFTYDKALGLGQRARAVRERIDMIHGAPYDQMPLFASFKDLGDALITGLEDEGRGCDLVRTMHELRRVLALLLTHARIAQLITIPGKARRFDRKFTPLEVVALREGIEALLHDLKELEVQTAIEGDAGSYLVLRLVDTLEVLDGQVADPEVVYNLFSEALDLYNEF